MNDQSHALTICKRAQDMANEGRLSQFGLNELMQAVAQSHFGGSMSDMLALDSMGRPATSFGKIFCRAQTARRLATEQAELLKREGRTKDTDPRSRDDFSTGGRERHDNEGSHDMTANHLNEDDETDAEKPLHTSVNRQDTHPDRQSRFRRAVKTLMAKYDCSEDAAISMIHRAEKAARGFV